MPQEGLIPLFLTVQVQAKTLNEWLTRAYNGIDDDAKTLCLIRSTEKPSSTVRASIPPVGEVSSFPFQGKDTAWLGTWLNENHTNTPITNACFLVFDEQSSATDSMMFVRIGRGGLREQLRLGSARISMIPTAITAGTIGLEELQDLVGSDGVFRG